MDTNEPLINAIREDFSDLDRQLRYADVLEQQSDSVLGPYVRLMVLLQQTPGESDAFCDIQSQRRKLLDAEPSRWQWDNFLSLRHLTTFGSEISRLAFEIVDEKMVKRSPAELASIEDLESKLGCTLPVAYRAFLTELSDGSRLLVSNIDYAPVLYSVDELRKALDHSNYLTQVRAQTCVNWHKGVCNWDAEVDVLGDKHECPPGFLPIAAYPLGQAFLALNGELRGAIWFRGDFDELFSFNHTESQHPEDACSEQVKSLPLDAISAIRDMVIGRFEELGRLPDKFP